VRSGRDGDGGAGLATWCRTWNRRRS